MPAYVVIVREKPFHDAAKYAEYQRIAALEPGDFAMKPLAFGGAVETIEGAESPDGIVLLEFPTVEKAKEWYTSPGYQAAVPHRLASAEYRAFIVEGL